MKVDITIEFDKELADALMDTFRDFSEGIKNLQENLAKSDKSDKSDLSVSAENKPEDSDDRGRTVQASLGLIDHVLSLQHGWLNRYRICNWIIFYQSVFSTR